MAKFELGQVLPWVCATPAEECETFFVQMPTLFRHTRSTTQNDIKATEWEETTALAEEAREREGPLRSRVELHAVNRLVLAVADKCGGEGILAVWQHGVEQDAVLGAPMMILK
jgi:hypothetical protein